MKRKALAAALALLASLAANAQSDYPSHPIKLIVTSTPGSTSDITARLLAQKIGAPLGQTVVVENRPGAGGAIGMQAVAKSKADGYTLVVGCASCTVVPQAIMKSWPLDLFRDFAPISLIANTTLVMVVHKDSPVNTVRELVAATKRVPGKSTYGNSAGLFQLSMELFNLQAGIDLLAVGYKGPAEAATDLIGGRLTVMPDSFGAATRNIKAGRTKPLAVFSAARSAALPEVPTMLELGYKDFEFNGWIGILAPAGTPEPIIQRLHMEIARATASEDLKQQFANQGVEATSNTPKEYAAMLAREAAQFAKIAKDAGIERQ